MATNEDYLDSLLKNVVDSQPDEGQDQDHYSDMDLSNMLDMLGEGSAEQADDTAGSELVFEDGDIQPDSFEDSGAEDLWKEVVESENGEEPEDAEMYENDDPVTMMSPEEIDAMFTQMDSEEDAGQKNPASSFDGDIDDLLGLEADVDFNDIGMEEIENSSKETENEEMDDMAALLSHLEDAELQGNSVSENEESQDGDTFGFFDMPEAEEIPMDSDIAELLEAGDGKTEDTGENTEEPVEQKKKRGRKERIKKVKKSDPQEQESGGTGKEKKPGFFTKLFQALTEEEESEFEGLQDSNLYNMDEENQIVIKELDSEEPQKGKKKKKKKEKETAQEGEEGQDDEKKPVKEKKPKKEKVKKEKPQKEPAKKGKPLAKSKIFTAFLFGVSIFAVIYILTNYLPMLSEQRAAEKAFEEKNYSAAFEKLEGKELSEEEETIYNTSILVLQLERQLESYHNYIVMDMELEALNALVRGVGKYQAGLADAERYGVTAETDKIYQELLSLLQQEYSLGEQDVLSILEQKDDVHYTMELKKVLGDTSFLTNSGEGSITGADDSIQNEDVSDTPDTDGTNVLTGGFGQDNDVLPAEEDFIQE